MRVLIVRSMNRLVLFSFEHEEKHAERDQESRLVIDMRTSFYECLFRSSSSLRLQLCVISFHRLRFTTPFP